MGTGMESGEIMGRNETIGEGGLDGGIRGEVAVIGREAEDAFL